MPDERESDRVPAGPEAIAVKKNWTKIAIALGPVLLMASVVWEYARMNPSYNFLLTPWALRGYETNHGPVFLTLAGLMLIGGLLTGWEAALRERMALAVTAYFVAAATLFAAVFTDQSISITFTTLFSMILAAFVAGAIAAMVRDLFGDRVRILKRALPVFIVVFVVLALLSGVTLVGTTVEQPVWIVVLAAFLLFGALSVVIKPLNMAANRMLITSSVGAWGVVVLSGGAVRQNLIDEQLVTEQAGGVTGIAAQYKDTQAASGWWFAGFAMFILFIGAVGLWARRRDIVAAIARARRQREAAEASAREIQEAAEMYAKEKAHQAATAPSGTSPQATAAADPGAESAAP